MPRRSPHPSFSLPTPSADLGRAGVGISEGRAAVKIDGRTGYIDVQGRAVIAPRFRHASPFSEGLARVKLDGEAGFINLCGETVISPQFKLTGKFRQGLCLITTENTIGYINQRGEFVWEGPYVEMNLGSDLRL